MLLLAALATDFYFILQLGPVVFTVAPYLFLAVFVASYFADILLFIPSQLLIQFVLIDIATHRKLMLLQRSITIQVKHIIKRTSGFFWNKYFDLQYFNPACRAARGNTVLSASKLLASCNDCDFTISISRKISFFEKYVETPIYKALYYLRLIYFYIFIFFSMKTDMLLLFYSPNCIFSVRNTKACNRESLFAYDWKSHISLSTI
jgi:hypothetical protein